LFFNGMLCLSSFHLEVRSPALHCCIDYRKDLLHREPRIIPNNI
jgi:hypothetical protein